MQNPNELANDLIWQLTGSYFEDKSTLAAALKERDDQSRDKAIQILNDLKERLENPLLKTAMDTAVMAITNQF